MTTNTTAALRVAMKRLLSGKPQRTDGRLTISNLAAEAGVSRATANRATTLLTEFRTAVEKLNGRRFSPRAFKGRIKELECQLSALRQRETAEMKELRISTKVMAQHIQILTLQLANNNRLIEKLQQQLDPAKIVPITSTRKGKT
jgi:predicted RNase H-like nuclease (RuvC/YqgF family)